METTYRSLKQQIMLKPITTLNLNNSLPDAPVCPYYLSAISVPDQIPSIFHA